MTIDARPPGSTRGFRPAVLAVVAVAATMLLVASQWRGTQEDAPSTLAAVTAPPLEPGIVHAGVEAPDFTLVSLDGRSVSLADFAGRPVIVNFWASWCPPCREEFPVLAAAREAHADSGLEILGVTHNDGVEYSRAFVEESGAEWPALLDPANSAWEAYDGVGLPTSFFVDTEGVIQRVHIGPVDAAQLADHLAAIGVTGTVAPLNRP